MVGNQIQTPFSHHHQTTPSESLDRGPISLILAGYRLVVLRPLCACSTILCFCLLSFPHRFCRSRLALFCFASCCSAHACLVFFCLFFDLVSFLLYVFSVVAAFVFFHCVFSWRLVWLLFFFYKDVMGFIGLLPFIGSKRAPGPICLNLLQICILLQIFILLHICILQQTCILLQITSICISSSAQV